MERIRLAAAASAGTKLSLAYVNRSSGVNLDERQCRSSAKPANVEVSVGLSHAASNRVCQMNLPVVVQFDEQRVHVDSRRSTIA